MGLIEIRKTGQLFQGVHQPLISKELFDRVQAVLDGRYQHRSTCHTFLFQRLVFCKHCGYRLNAERQKGHTYYRCHTKSCPRTCVREEVIEERIVGLLNQLSLADHEFVSLKTLALQQRSEWIGRQENEKKSIELNLARIDDRLARLTDALLDELIDQNTFETRKRALLLERKALRDGLERTSSDQGSLPTRLTKFLELAKTASLGYRSGTLYEKRNLLKSITSNLVVDQKNVVVALRPVFHALANRQKADDSGPYRGDPRTGMTQLYQTLLKHLEVEHEQAAERDLQKAA